MQKLPAVLTVIIAMLMIVIHLSVPKELPDFKREFKKVAKASRESKDDPYARFNYEMERLVNPRTGTLPADIRKRELEYASRLPVRADLTWDAVGKTSGETGNWKLRGPFNVGGRTRALALDVADEDVIIAGGVSGGMWISENSGAGWQKTTQPAQLHSTTCLVQDTRPGKTQIWYHGTGEPVGNSASDGNAYYSGDGIFKSTDGGYTWNVLPSTSTNVPQTYENYFDYVWNLAVDVSNVSQDEVYAAVSGGIFRSTNGGFTWSPVKVSSTASWAYYTDVAVTSSGVVYATLSSEGGADAGIWRSADGVSWTRITPAGWPSQYRRTVIGIAPSSENVVYFLSDTPGGGTSNHSLWKYTWLNGDGSGSGGAWENRSANIPAEGGSTGNFSSQNSYDLVIRVKPDNANAVFIGGVNLYRSDNGFADKSRTSWIGGYVSSNDSYANYTNHHCDQHALFFYPSDPSKLLSGHDGGISFTANCMANTVSWTILNRGYFTTQYYTIALDPGAAGDNIIVGGTQDNGTWFVNGALQTTPWVDIFSGDGSYCAIAPGKDFYCVSFQNGETYRLSLTSTGLWTNYPARIDPAGGTGYRFINPFKMDPNVSGMMYLAGGSVMWRNTDVTALPVGDPYDPPSLNWTELTNTKLPAGAVSAVEVSTAPANRLYYGTTQGRIYRLDGAHAGNPVPAEITGSGFPAGYVSCIAVNPENADQILVVFSNYEVLSIWASADGGSSWQNISGNLEENSNGTGNGPSVRWAEILPTNEGTIYYAGTSTGLYSTTNLNGLSTVWFQEGPSTIGNVVVDMIDSRTTDNLVVVATHGNGVYSTNAAVTELGGTGGETVALDYVLYQNYPNPFNPSTAIRYALPRPSDVSLQIYNLQGQSVVTLVREFQNAGSFEITWNGHDHVGRRMPSGVYVYRLVAGGHEQTRRMILLK